MTATSPVRRSTRERRTPRPFNPSAAPGSYGGHERGTRMNGRLSSDVFAVAAILARSLDQAHNSAGKLEHFYVVRWEGYGPEDDTWESYSNVAEGSGDFVREFDSKPHPATLLGWRNGRDGPEHLVRFGTATRRIPPSPLYQQLWLSRAEMQSYGLSQDVLALAKRQEKSGEGFLGTSSSTGSRRSSTPDDRATKKPRRMREVTILGSRREVFQKKGQRHYVTVYLAHWVNTDGSEDEAWLSSQVIVARFGKRCRALIDEFRSSERKPVQAEENEYEAERQKRIAENKELLAQLGLGGL